MSSNVAGASDRASLVAPRSALAPGWTANHPNAKITKPDMPAVRPESDAPLEPACSRPALDDEERPTAVDPLSKRAAGASAERDRAVLIRLAGASAGQAHVFAKDGMTRVGRGKGADLKLDDEGVSRMHAMISYEDGAFVLTDLGSRNGTTVEDELVTRRALADGDIVRFGAHSTFRFALVDREYVALLEQLYRSSVRDPMTGAHNRQYFDERLHAEIAYALRQDSNVSLLLLDIDHFKRVNDTFGHPAGDAVLRFVASLVEARLRTEDVFARYGGEEFAVILRGIDVAGAARAAERLRGAIGGSAPCIDGNLIPVTISVGCASLRCCAAPRPDLLVAAADRRLYVAKHAGRNRVVASDRAPEPPSGS
jgi:diguanylate cyclase (GGDEF)-like protein